MLHVCSRPGCPNLTPSAGRCTSCARVADVERGTASQRGYTSAGHRRLFRAEVLRRDPVCTQDQYPDGDGKPCLEWSTVADHYPRSRAELVAAGEDPNDPAHGRGLCKRHHDRSTALHQPGGWNRPRS